VILSNGIIVLGMHRSGTSLIAELIHRWGAFGRVGECLPSNQWNARGYWELAPLVSLNRKLLRETGSNWSFPPSQKRDADLAALASHPKYRNEALSLIASMNLECGHSWFWKDPRLSLLLPFWQQLWGQPRYVICLRDPFEICSSLQERDNLSLSVSLMLWHRYMVSILEWTRGFPAIVMSYSKVLGNPQRECERLANFLSCQEQYRDPVKAAAEMKKSVDGKLRHCKSDAGRAGFLTRRQRNLQDALDLLADSGDVESVNLRNCSLPAGWRALLRAELLKMRCHQRWNKLFPETALPNETVSPADALAVSYARGLHVLGVNAQFTSHNGVLLDSNMSARRVS